MSIFNTISECIKNPKRFLILLNDHGFHWLFSDKFYLKSKFSYKMKRKLDLKNPKTYNEKLQWLKLNDHQPIYTTMVDKYKVKGYVAEKLGEEYIIPTLGVYDKFDDINFEKLPNEFVIKCSHDSGGIVICKDKKSFDIKKARKKVNKLLKTNYFIFGREWPYKNVERKIIIEKYMVDESGYELKDYKFFCFNGKVKLLFVAKDRQKAGEEVKFDFFDTEFNHLPFKQKHPMSEPPYFKPENFDKMIELAEKLSTDIPQVRVDFYNINGNIYFGEFTFFHHGGCEPFHPDKWDIELGKYIDLGLVKTNI